MVEVCALPSALIVFIGCEILTPWSASVIEMNWKEMAAYQCKKKYFSFALLVSQVEQIKSGLTVIRCQHATNVSMGSFSPGQNTV